MYLITKVVAGSFSAALTSQNEVLVWGGDMTQYASPQKVFVDDVRFVDICLNKGADSFLVSLDQDGLVYSWGAN